MSEQFWENEEKQRRMARYQARFLSWQSGRRIVPPPFIVGEHWIHNPFLDADTNLPFTGGEQWTSLISAQ